MLENRAPHVVAGDYTPHSSVNIWPKDLGIVLDVAAHAKFAAPITSAALQQFLAAASRAWGRRMTRSSPKPMLGLGRRIFPGRNNHGFGLYCWYFYSHHR